MFELSSVHIPKTAGTSFGAALLDWYGRQLSVDYGGLKSRPGKTKLAVHSQFPAEKREADRVITWLRDPAARIVSMYYFWRALPPANNPTRLQMVTETYRCSISHRCQWRYLAPMSPARRYIWISVVQLTASKSWGEFVSLIRVIATCTAEPWNCDSAVSTSK